MTKQELLHIVQTQLATDLNCTPADLNSEKDSFVFTEAKDNPGRRPFPRKEQHFEMLSMGKAIIVSASPDILAVVKPQLTEKSRDEAFSMPFVSGQGLYYLPDLEEIQPIALPGEFEYEIFEQDEIPALYQYEGFHYAMQYDVDHPRPDVLTVLAKRDGHIVGMAGASNDCARLWQVGLNVLPEYRNFGLAAALVNWLTCEILERGYIPYYGTSSSNIASQRVAHRAGYYPAWVCAHKGIFNGLECAPTG